MKRGHLSEYFSGVAAKELSAVEAHPEISHQHEFNGSSELIGVLGKAGTEKIRIQARFLYLSDDDESVAVDSPVTWYDARATSAHRTHRSEHRLYFASNEVMGRAQKSDLLFVAKERGGALLVIVAASSSTPAAQLHWLFGLPGIPKTRFVARSQLEGGRDKVGLTAALILEQIGIEADLSDDRYLDALLRRFGPCFPSTRAFSAYARETLPEAQPADDPDAALLSWVTQEEVLFRTLEKHLIGGRLRSGFLHVGEPDIDGFLDFSLTVQNRRKARAGAALENHLEAIFSVLKVAYERGPVTERNNRPDFVFPSGRDYHDPKFPQAQLTMLAAKTTAKDRWRQVIKEADRIALKHLMTLEPAISEEQTNQMKESGIRLVVPAKLHAEFTPAQRRWLLDLKAFIDLVRTRTDARTARPSLL